MAALTSGIPKFRDIEQSQNLAVISKPSYFRSPNSPSKLLAVLGYSNTLAPLPNKTAVNSNSIPTYQGTGK